MKTLERIMSDQFKKEAFTWADCDKIAVTVGNLIDRAAALKRSRRVQTAKCDDFREKLERVISELEDLRRAIPYGDPEAT
jgi:hypothetical protein